MPIKNYIDINKDAWNKKTRIHLDSDFYDVPSFLNGKSSLNDIELALLGNVKGKSILHLQCHFGQDSISLAKLGAKVTGVDLSNIAIDTANNLAQQTNTNMEFVCCNIYDLPTHLHKKFDIVYTSYGTIGWLPNLTSWAKVIAHFLKPKGKFVFVEFHPVVWMFDDDFKDVSYNYFNSGPLLETEIGTYANRNNETTFNYINWNHGISEVLTSLFKNKLQLKVFNEYNYSPYNCFKHTYKIAENQYRITHLEDRIPMVYGLKATF